MTNAMQSVLIRFGKVGTHAAAALAVAFGKEVIAETRAHFKIYRSTELEREMSHALDLAIADNERKQRQGCFEQWIANDRDQT